MDIHDGDITDELNGDGMLIIDGRDVTLAPVHERRVGLLTQDVALFPHLSALENVAYGPRACGVRRAQARAQAYEWLERLGVAGLAHRRPEALSGGQAQRVALARGLVARPAVLFADEPTGALDSLTGEQVMDLLVESARAQGTTVVLVTHDARVAAYADRQVIVRDGRVNALVHS